ncbi:MAG: hypothetical protein ABI760_17125 [Ferruginibacter sp.]
MERIIALLIMLNLFPGSCKAQFYIAPVVGFQTDLNNRNSFKQINSAVLFGIRKSRHYELMFLAQKAWPHLYNSRDSSFSPNPALPVYATAKKTIRPSSYSLAIGHRISLIGVKSRNIFSLVFYSGITFQKIAVTYQYNKNDYTILNPDKTQERTGFFLSGGMEYMRLLKNGRLFVQLNAATPPLAKEINYPSSFGLIAPLSLNAGYSIPIKKSRHEKK